MRTTRKPHPLFDTLLKVKKLPHDKALSDALKIESSIICKARSSDVVSDYVRVAIARHFGWSMKRIDGLAPPKPAEPRRVRPAKVPA